MADGPGAKPPPDPQAVARDWITIWQSELTALATDREVQDGWIRLVALWAHAAEAATRLIPAVEPAHGRTGSAAAPGPAPVMAAFDARDAAIERLAGRVEELERRLAALAPGGAAGPG